MTKTHDTPLADAYRAAAAAVDAAQTEIAEVPVCPCCDAGADALTDDTVSVDVLCEECSCVCYEDATTTDEAARGSSPEGAEVRS